jgi:glycosyltransferase involved in cell wall biosynthesis
LKTIGIVHYKVGGTDGVSLEIDKWKTVLEDMGHKVHLCAGDLGQLEGTLIEELFHHLPDIERLNTNTFINFVDYSDEDEYRVKLENIAKTIEEGLLNFVRQKGIDYLIIENLWSNSTSPPASLAASRLVRSTGIPTLAHHHDFYWERVDGIALTNGTALELIEKNNPPRISCSQNVVINSLAQEELLARKGIASSVIPNVFDFESAPWRPDEYNRDFRQQLGFTEVDVLILQATRIMPRKGIELAFDFVNALNHPERRAQLEKRGLYDGRSFTKDSRIALVLAGYTEDEITGEYIKKLKRKRDETATDAIFIEDVIGGSRRTENGKKIFSLWDTYVYADFITYPSYWEGWGNQFLEALRAKLPLMLFEYPVYKADIEDKGFSVVSLGSDLAYGEDGLVHVPARKIEEAADQAVDLLTDFTLREEVVESNFEIGRRHYSLDALSKYLLPIIDGRQ